MCVAEYRVSRDSEGDGAIGRVLMKGFLPLQSVVPGLCNMGERVLRRMKALSETEKRKAEREGEFTLRHLETRTAKPDIMIREPK